MLCLPALAESAGLSLCSWHGLEEPHSAKEGRGGSGKAAGVRQEAAGGARKESTAVIAAIFVKTATGRGDGKLAAEEKRDMRMFAVLAPLRGNCRA